MQVRSEFECNRGELEMCCGEVGSGRPGRKHHAELGIILLHKCRMGSSLAGSASAEKKLCLRERQTSHRAAQGLHPTEHSEGFGLAAQHW